MRNLPPFRPPSPKRSRDEGPDIKLPVTEKKSGKKKPEPPSEAIEQFADALVANEEALGPGKGPSRDEVRGLAKQNGLDPDEVLKAWQASRGPLLEAQRRKYRDRISGDRAKQLSHVKEKMGHDWRTKKEIIAVCKDRVNPNKIPELLKLLVKDEVVQKDDASPMKYRVSN